MNVCKQTFHISYGCTSQKVKGVLMWNLHHIIFIWRQGYWQIFNVNLLFYFHIFVNEKRKCASSITRKHKHLIYNFWNWKETWNMNFLWNKWIQKANFIFYFFTKQETFINIFSNMVEESHMRRLNLLMSGGSKKVTHT